MCLVWDPEEDIDYIKLGAKYKSFPYIAPRKPTTPKTETKRCSLCHVARGDPKHTEIHQMGKCNDYSACLFYEGFFNDF